MTRKDYEVIAVALAQSRVESGPLSGANGPRTEGVDLCIEHISHALQVVEPRFDSGKFRKFINSTYMKMKY